MTEKIELDGISVAIIREHMSDGLCRIGLVVIHRDELKAFRAADGALKSLIRHHATDPDRGTAADHRTDAEVVAAIVTRLQREAETAKSEVARLGAKHSAMAKEYAKEMDVVLKLQRQLLAVQAGREDVWFWRGNGDDPASLICPVVMSADTLREFVAERTKREEAERNWAALCNEEKRLANKIQWWADKHSEADSRATAAEARATEEKRCREKLAKRVEEECWAFEGLRRKLIRADDALRSLTATREHPSGLRVCEHCGLRANGRLRQCCDAGWKADLESAHVPPLDALPNPPAVKEPDESERPYVPCKACGGANCHRLWVDGRKCCPDCTHWAPTAPKPAQDPERRGGHHLDSMVEPEETPEQVCDRLGIDVPKWAAEVREKIAAAQKLVPRYPDSVPDAGAEEPPPGMPDAATHAFDEIVKALGWKDWDYPMQVVRGVRELQTKLARVNKFYDGAVKELGAAQEALSKRDAEVMAMTERLSEWRRWAGAVLATRGLQPEGGAMDDRQARDAIVARLSELEAREAPERAWERGWQTGWRVARRLAGLDPEKRSTPEYYVPPPYVAPEKAGGAG